MRRALRGSAGPAPCLFPEPCYTAGATKRKGGMQDFTEHNLTRAVISRMAEGQEARLRQVMTSLVEHVHAFVREVRPTPAEWLAAIEFLTRTGQISDHQRQEYILLSDTLGITMLVDAVQHAPRKATTDGAVTERAATERAVTESTATESPVTESPVTESPVTESSVLGPFYVEGAPELPAGANIAQRAGEPLLVRGRVSSTDGTPLAGALLDVWQNDSNGLYDVQDPGQPQPHLRGKFRSDAAGQYSFRTVRPVSYPIPTDGPVGQLLARLGRHPYRPAHVHFKVSASGHQSVVTELFDAGDGYLETDVVFGVKRSLVVQFERQSPSAELVLDYDFVLQPESRRP
jgi:hydroxyquinol 1,2-dioxygenase